MRILLTANASYLPPRGGATRSNLLWLRHLASAGHACRAVCAALPRGAPGAEEQIRDEQIRSEWAFETSADGVEIARRSGLTVLSVAGRSGQLAVLRREIREFRPDWVLVSSEDLGHALLREASHSAPGRVVYLAHTPQFYPFGPASWNPDPLGTELVAAAAGIVAIGRHTAAYVREHTGRDAAVVHPPVYGEGPFENFGCFDKGLISMVNPCALKGISIFLALAGRFPQFTFGALPGWGTTSADRAELEKRPNVRILANVRNIREVLSRTRVLLMPSLWYEGFGLSVMEAMLHGIPVISSDSGGLLDAKMGTGFVIPVRPIERFEPVFDEHGLPKPVVPPPDIAPWSDALSRLLSDRALYQRESALSRERALSFVSGLRASDLETFLLSLKPAPQVAERPPRPPRAVETLSPERRALLLGRLRGKPARTTGESH